MGNFGVPGRRWNGRALRLTGSAAFAVACASQPAPQETTPANPPAPAPGSNAEPSPEPSPAPTPASSGELPSKPQTAAPAAPTPVELCNAMCDRVTKKCSENAAESCRMNCTQYEHPPEGCDAQVRAALECAAKADDLQCVNIAPESCAADFRRVVACASGKPDGAMPEDPTKIPDDWQRFESSAFGFSAPMPKGVTEKSGAPSPTFAVTAGDANYQVRILPPPKDPPTQKNLVKVAMGLIGKCQKNLKLFGMVERPQRVSIRFQSSCPANAELGGLIAIASGKMYVLETTAPKGSKSPKDPFFYGFEVR